MDDDRELLAVEIDATYKLDAKGRFAGTEATRFFLGQTKSGNIICFGYDPPNAIIQELESLASREPVVSDLRAGLTYLDEYQRILGKWKPVKQIAHGLGYKYPNELKRFPDVVKVEKSNVHLGADTFPWLSAELDNCQPCLAIVEQGRLVAVFRSVRVSTRAHVAGVVTHEDYRRKGYATAVAAEWGIAVRELGLLPIYSTELENIASQRVAEKVGLVLYNADHHFK